MSALATLARLRGRVVVNGLRGVRRESVLKVLVVAVAGGAFWVGVLLASFEGFRFIDDYLGGAELLAETLLSMFFLLLAVMLLFSNAIISYGSLFRSEEAELLLTWPVEPQTVFLYKLLESVSFSSWAFVVLGFPLMLGYGLSASAPWYYPAMILAYFAPFMVLAACVGGVVALGVAAYLPGWAKRVLGLSAVACVVVALSLLAWIHGAVRASGGVFTEMWLPRTLGRMSFSRSVFLPSFWVTRGLMEGARGELGEAVYYLLVLSSNAALGVLVCWGLGQRLLRVGWSRSRSKAGGRRRSGESRWVLARWMPAMRLLVSKDWRLFVRDPVQWSQCAILFGLMGFYVLNLRTFSYHLSLPMWRDLTALLNLAATSLVLATVTTRFVFPLPSLEARRFWFLGPAPVDRGTILWAKFAFSLAAALVVTLPLVVASGHMLRLPAAAIVHHGAAIVLVCFGVSGLSVGLGAVFPNRREQNPSKIVAGFGGTLNLLLSIAFVVVEVGLTALPYGLRLMQADGGGVKLGWFLLASGVVAGVAGLVPMRVGLRALRRLEF